MQHDDATLVEQVRGGDEFAFLKLYKKHEHYVRGVVRRHLGADEQTDEVVQDVFYSLLEKLPYYRGDCALTTYLYTIARGKSIDHIRRKKVSRAIHKVIPHAILAKMKSLRSTDLIERQEVEERIETILSQIPHDYAIIIRLKYIDELSIVEIAKRLEISAKTAESRLYRARQSFQTLWTR